MIHVSHVTKKFGTFSAVHQLDMDIKPGEVYTMIGKNGAGKTTLIKCLTG